MLSEKPWKLESVALLMTALLMSLFIGMSLALVLEQFLSFNSQGDKMFVQFLYVNCRIRLSNIS